jgi:hypothetical protein
MINDVSVAPAVPAFVVYARALPLDARPSIIDNLGRAWRSCGFENRSRRNPSENGLGGRAEERHDRMLAFGGSPWFCDAFGACV